MSDGRSAGDTGWETGSDRGRRVLAGLAAALACAGLVACGGTGDAGGDAGADTAAVAETEAAAEAGAAAAAGGALLDPNGASPDALRGLDGLPGPAASALLEARPFSDMVAVDSLLAAHMDASARQDLYRRMWIPLSLNDASDEEILLIPGVGERMLGEFREYRPYRSMEQFRREIGKYVDDDELARLERYVRLDG